MQVVSFGVVTYLGFTNLSSMFSNLGLNFQLIKILELSDFEPLQMKCWRLIGSLGAASDKDHLSEF